MSPASHRDRAAPPLIDEPLCQRVEAGNPYACAPRPFAGFNASSTAYVLAKGIPTGVGHAFPDFAVHCAIALRVNLAYSPYSELKWGDKQHGLHDFFERALGLGLAETPYARLCACKISPRVSHILTRLPSL